LRSAAYSGLSLAFHSASARGCKNQPPKFTITTPPFLATARSMSSVILRGAFTSARAEECEAITGARVVLRTS
jgi:hypothetical protein